MPFFIVCLAMYVAFVGFSFYPHWSAYVVGAFVIFLLFVAHRWRISERKLRAQGPRPYTHPKLENQNPRKQLNPDPLAGDDTNQF